VFASNRASARDEIWVCDADGANPSKLFTTQLSQTGYSGSPRWSPDGKWIAFDSEIDGHWQIFTVPAQGGKPRQMTKEWNNARPSWSHDGRWIYFTSQRSRQQEIWRIPVGAGEPEQTTKNGGSDVIESADGKSIWYDSDQSIWSARIDGSGAVRVVNGPIGAVGFALTRKGIYYYSRGPHEVLEFFNFATGKSRALLTPDKPPNIGLSVSPDEHWLIYSQMDREAGSNLMLVDNFR
jgi:Tol biopolymer transport system component